MINLDFDSTKNKEKSVADLKSLIDNQGWLLLVSIVTANIEFIKDQILNGIENETPESINRLRDKLKAYKDIIETPQKQIDRMTTSVNFDYEDPDPYGTVAEDE